MIVYVLFVNPAVQYQDECDMYMGVYADLEKAEQDGFNYYKNHPASLRWITECYNEEFDITLEDYIRQCFIHIEEDFIKGMEE